MKAAENYYVGWVDLMGAGHAMGTSVQKTANFLARLHMAIERSRKACSFEGRLLPINDGVFVVARSKRELMSMVGRTMVMLSANFIAIPRPHDRFLLRSGIAYGPVYFGDDLVPGLRPKQLREGEPFLDRVMFGPALIQAYRGEAAAPPYGVAIHESARAFCPLGEELMTPLIFEIDSFSPRPLAKPFVNESFRWVASNADCGAEPRIY